MKKRERLERQKTVLRSFESAADKMLRISKITSPPNKKLEKLVNACGTIKGVGKAPGPGGFLGSPAQYVPKSSSMIWGTQYAPLYYSSELFAPEPNYETIFSKWEEENNKEELFFTDYIVGYRNWTVDPETYELCPLTYVKERWATGENVAICAGPMSESKYYGKKDLVKHKAPFHDCQCGLYANFSVEEAVWPPYGPDPTFVVSGAVALWGDIQVHETGVRAEKACVLALSTASITRTVYNAETFDYEKINTDCVDGLKEALEVCAAKYEVPVVRKEDLPAAALLYGEPLPREVIPKFTEEQRNAWIMLDRSRSYRNMYGAFRI